MDDREIPRRPWGLLISMVALWTATATATATAVAGPREADCPLAHAAYSSRTILLDLLINPETLAVLKRDAPALLTPPMGEGSWPSQPPSFAAILTPEALQHLGTDASLTQLDADLSRIPVTAEAARARCARYDRVPPSLPPGLKQPSVLVFDKVTGFRDDASITAAEHALRAMAGRLKWSLVRTDNAAVFNDRDLRRFDVVVWNNVSGDVLTVAQERAFKEWLNTGGGYVGIHGSGGDPVYVWSWYVNRLLGAQFKGHPLNPQFQSATVNVSDPHAGITRGMDASWTMSEEWYSFTSSPRLRGAHVLATLDETTYSPLGIGGMDLRMGDHPIAWTQCIRDGRAFYTAIGHRPESYSEPHALRLLQRGIAWAAGRGETRCRGGEETLNASK